MPGPQSTDNRASSRVVLVEDDRDLARAICAAVEAEGFAVVHLQDGEAGLDYLSNSPAPLLILLDLNMPVVNEWEFRRRQTEDPRIANVPVIVMSAHQTGVLADPSGISFYLKKPFPLDLLLGYIRRLANRTR